SGVGRDWTPARWGRSAPPGRTGLHFPPRLLSRSGWNLSREVLEPSLSGETERQPGMSPPPHPVPASRLAGVGHLLEVQLDATGVIVAELVLQVLNDPRLQRAGQLAPGLALVLATLLPVTAEGREPPVRPA